MPSGNGDGEDELQPQIRGDGPSTKRVHERPESAQIHAKKTPRLLRIPVPKALLQRERDHVHPVEFAQERSRHVRLPQTSAKRSLFQEHPHRFHGPHHLLFEVGNFPG